MTKSRPSPTPNWPPKKWHIAVAVTIIVLFILGVIIRFVRAYTVEDGWTVFDSQQQLIGQNNPDGFRLEYPKSWEVEVYSGGGIHNLGELRVGFNYPYYLFTSNRFLNVWWRRVENDWTRYDARDWYIEDIGFGIRKDVLLFQRDLFQETEIGIEKYPALVWTFNFTDKTKKRILVFTVGDEAFALDFNSEIDDSETEKIFEQMLDSIEVYD